MVFGGQAVLLYGEPRLTRDIDITLGVDINSSALVIDTIHRLGLQLLTDNPEDFLRDTMILPAIDPATDIRVDFVFSLLGFERAAIEHAKIVNMEGVDVRFVPLEDLLVMKIIAGRPRDIEDVVSVIRKNPNYNRSQVEKWLREFDAELDAHYLDDFVQLMAKINS